MHCFLPLKLHFNILFYSSRSLLASFVACRFIPSQISTHFYKMQRAFIITAHSSFTVHSVKTVRNIGARRILAGARLRTSITNGTKCRAFFNFNKNGCKLIKNDTFYGSNTN